MKAKIKLTLLLITYVISGAIINIILKYLSIQESLGIRFSHDWLIIFFVFLSETFALFMYCIKNHKSKSDSKNENDQEISEDKKREGENELKPIPFKKKIFLIWFSSFLDCFASSLGVLSLNITEASDIILLKGLMFIIIIFTISWIRAKKRPIIDYLIGFIGSIISFILICLSAFIVNENNDDYKIFIISFALMFIAMSCQSVQNLLIEENKIRKYRIHQFLFIGLEGVFGSIFNLILCIILYFINCDPNEYTKQICTQDDKENWKVENSLFAFKQIYENYIILILLIIFMIIIAIYNMIAISIIKYGGALTRGLVENIRTILVWIIFLIPWTTDSLRENFNWYRLAGVLFIIGSLLFYFTIFKIDEKMTIRSKITSLHTLSCSSSINEGTDQNDDSESLMKEDNGN